MSQPEAAPPGRQLLTSLPFLFFGALAIIFFVQLYASPPSKLPSAMIGRAAPAFELPPLAGLSANGIAIAGFTTADLKSAKPTLVNVFASWCVPCHEEHPFLMELARDARIRVVGINYKDHADNARRFLGARGNPYSAVGIDPNGRAAIDWGVYGVPETFLVRPDGTIAFKLVGPINAENLKSALMPEIEKALKR